MTKVQVSEVDFLARYADEGHIDGLTAYWRGWLESRTKTLIEKVRRELAGTDSAREVERLLTEQEARFARENAAYGEALKRARHVAHARQALDREGLRLAGARVLRCAVCGDEEVLEQRADGCWYCVEPCQPNPVDPAGGAL